MAARDRQSGARIGRFWAMTTTVEIWLVAWLAFTIASVLASKHSREGGLIWIGWLAGASFVALLWELAG